MTPISVPIVRLDPDLPMPTYAHPGDAGADVYARDDTVIVARGGRALISTGFAMALPEGWAGFVQPRSGLALRHGVTVLNSPGLIDSGYRDEVRVILVNTDREIDHKVARGDRIAQLVIRPVAEASFAEVDELSDSERNLGGFGSTGAR